MLSERVKDVFTWVMYGAQSKHPGNAGGVHAASRHSHEAAWEELPESD
jgi:hypothetical protein